MNAHWNIYNRKNVLKFEGGLKLVWGILVYSIGYTIYITRRMQCNIRTVIPYWRTVGKKTKTIYLETCESWSIKGNPQYLMGYYVALWEMMWSWLPPMLFVHMRNTTLFSRKHKVGDAWSHWQKHPKQNNVALLGFILSKCVTRE